MLKLIYTSTSAKPLRIVVRLHSSDGAELPGSPQTFLPRSGVEPVAEALVGDVDHRHRLALEQHLGETGPLSRGVQARRKALRIRYTNGMEVRKKRPRGFKKRPRGFK